MKLSIIVATRNRAHAITGCLDSIAVSLASAAPLEAEIVVVDNGSEDATPAVIEQWAATSAFPVRLLREPKAGASIARNRALRAAQGELLAFTDDDCRLSETYVNDLLRHDACDGDTLVLRGGRIELGDPDDLPLTIKTTPTRIRFNRRTDPATQDSIIGHIGTCNMAMRRGVVARLGPFDERFGPGAPIPSGEDADYLFRAYLADITLEYVPDMAVLHYHGRKRKAEGFTLARGYSIGAGAVYAKYFFRHPDLCRAFYWDMKKSVKEILSGTNTFLPFIGFSHKHKVAYTALGAVRYFRTRKI